MSGPDKATLVVDIGPLRERFYTGIPNVIAELCTRLLREDWLDLHFELDGRWADNDGVRRCLEQRSGTGLMERHAQFPTTDALRQQLEAAGTLRRAVALYTDHRPPQKRYGWEGKIVYDLSMVLLPECHPADSVRMYTADLAQQIANSDVLFPISEATARDLAWIYGVDPARLKVALLGNDVDQAAATRLRDRLGGRAVEPFLLVLGSIEPRKNVALVLQWLASHPDVLREVRVVFAGRQAWGESFAASLARFGLVEQALAGRIVFTGFVDEAFRTALLVGARALLYPSLYEGFGLPLLEAMATGTPVLHSVSSSMPEVVGDCGYGFDPCDPASLHAAYRRLCADHASGALTGVVERARRRADTFSYDATYRAVIDGLFGRPGQAGAAAP